VMLSESHRDKRRDRLTMDYFEDLHNESLNKYIKNLK
jgi:hypothetical protein